MRLKALCFSLCLFGSVVPFSNSHAQNNSSQNDGLLAAFSSAYNNNPSLMAAREEFKKTQELFPQARAGWLPSVNAETSLFTTDIDSSNFGNGDGATTKDVTFSVDQPIFRGGRTFAETSEANDLICAGKYILDKAEQDLFLDVASIYTNILRDREILTLRWDNEDILSKELEGAQERFSAGAITITEVHQAKASHSRARAQRIQAETNLDISNAQFHELVGAQPPNDMSLSVPHFEFPQTLEEMFEVAEQNNPELHAAKFQQLAAEHNTDAVFRELMPHISAFASYNKQYDPQPGIVDDTQTETIGVRASLALYNGGATRSRVREAKADARGKEYRIREVRNRIRQNIIRNHRSYLAAQERIKSRQLEIEAAQAALEGVREETVMGQRTMLDILDADEDLVDAKVALSQSQRDETITRFALATELGLLSPASYLP